MHLLHVCQIHPCSKFGDRTAGICRDNADINILYDDLKTQYRRSGWPSFWCPIRVC